MVQNAFENMTKTTTLSQKNAQNFAHNFTGFLDP